MIPIEYTVKALPDNTPVELECTDPKCNPLLTTYATEAGFLKKLGYGEMVWQRGMACAVVRMDNLALFRKVSRACYEAEFQD